ncbi:hypothetical protein [Haladaptatus halobius]|uniref:hypothetical protein n=1 Tax=Haladaptatus halobius TaxID=2884875 RepID=UPI001D0AF447|nr:hypothetical protein [Haladaptatus halobius]
MIDVYMEYFEHPYLFSLFPITLFLFAIGFAAQTAGLVKAAGFLGLYAMVTIILFVLGYTGFYSLRYGGRALRWWRKQQSAEY